MIRRIDKGAYDFMSLKLIAIDMDDTLLREDKTYDGDRLNYIVDEMKKREIIFCVASGNMYARLDEYLSNSDRQDIYFASDNGNYVVKNGETISSTSISREDFLELTRKIEERGHYNILISTGDKVYGKPVDEDKADFIHNYYRNIHTIETYSDVPLDQNPVKIACLSEYGLRDNKELAGLAKDHFPDIEAVTSGQGWTDFFHKEGGKGAAVADLQEKYDIAPEESIAFGDSMNDASMMTKVTYSVAVSNADEELKSLCDYEIGSNEVQSVFDVLEEFLETGSIEFLKKYRSNK